MSMEGVQWSMSVCSDGYRHEYMVHFGEADEIIAVCSGCADFRVVRKERTEDGEAQEE
jgi:hypothetical protein